MSEGRVTIDPEFRPPPPGDGQGRWLRAAGAVGVVVAAFVLGWFLRSPAAIEAELDAGSDTSTTALIGETAASTSTAIPSSTTTTTTPHSEPAEVIDLDESLGEAVPGFTDTVTVYRWRDSEVDVLRWTSSQLAPETMATFGSDEGFFGLDISGTWYAVLDQSQVLSVHQLDGGDAERQAGVVDNEFPFTPELGAVGVRVVAPAWHDSEPGQLAWLACSRVPGGHGTLFRLDVADAAAEPIVVSVVDDACSETAGAWLQQWGDWGFVLGSSHFVAHGSVVLAADGSEVTSLGGDSAGTWLVAASASGTIWTDGSPAPEKSSFLLSPDGQSVTEVPGLEEGKWLVGALWSQDGTRLALSALTTGQDDLDDLTVRIVEPRTGAVIAEIDKLDDWETWPAAWSTDSRFLVVEHLLCPRGCNASGPEARNLAFHDTWTDTTTVIRHPVQRDWGGPVLLTDAP